MSNSIIGKGRLQRFQPRSYITIVSLHCTLVGKTPLVITDDMTEFQCFHML